MIKGRALFAIQKTRDEFPSNLESGDLVVPLTYQLLQTIAANLTSESRASARFKIA